MVAELRFGFKLEIPCLWGWNNVIQVKLQDHCSGSRPWVETSWWTASLWSRNWFLISRAQFRIPSSSSSQENITFTFGGDDVGALRPQKLSGEVEWLRFLRQQRSCRWRNLTEAYAKETWRSDELTLPDSSDEALMKILMVKTWGTFLEWHGQVLGLTHNHVWTETHEDKHRDDR